MTTKSTVWPRDSEIEGEIAKKAIIGTLNKIWNLKMNYIR